jgi:FO synthase
VRSHTSAILDKALADEVLSAKEGYHLLHSAGDEVSALLATAGELRDRYKGRTVTYSRKVFLPVTNLCRDRCSYCTFRKDPRDPDAWTMSPTEIHEWLGRARHQGCKEALMCLGDKPELAYSSYRKTLAGFGHTTTTNYIYQACEIALGYGILPHTNAGVMTAEEMKLLKDVNVSLGLMLENISPRLRQRAWRILGADKDPPSACMIRSRRIEIPSPPAS